jgi:hypothetical protein
MADIVNLRRARKEKARNAKAEKAAENRILHGAPKAVRDLTAARSEKADKALEAHRLKPGKDLDK